MVSLSTALGIAVSGLTTSALQTAVVARNIANAGDADYSRKSASLIALPGGATAVASYDRSADKRLLDKLLGAIGSAAAKQAVVDALTRLGETVGDPESDASLAALTANLQTRLQGYESDPSNAALAAGVVQAASDLARGLNEAAAAVQEIRTLADRQMSAAVGRINALLEQFKIVNDAIVRGSGTAADLADNLDQRDRILRQLSQEIGVRTITRPNNDVAIYTDGGATLFETRPRLVAMAPTQTFVAGVAGNAVYVDGVSIAGPPSAMAGKGGALMGLRDVRDRIAVTYQTQLDEIARGLIELFAESDQSSPVSRPDAAGLFVHDGAPAVPAAGAAIAGMAAGIRVNPLAVPSLGGNPSLVRDGGFNGTAYTYNSSGDAGYQDRLAELIAAFDAPRGFDPAAQLESLAGVKTFGTQSAGWIEQQRKHADSEAAFDNALKSRASEALLRVTGVNIDEEMAAMLDLEKSYQASAKLIAAVDGMLAALLSSIG